ncbi:MAG TPA: stage II sporulation protein M [Caulobacteraceae bacterium]|nr:stage II sporulation protein M [Caulobacteraceae bacterium]
MAELRLKSVRFRAEREADWLKLESLVGKAERGAAGLSDDELLAMPVLYRSALSSLSVARATSLDSALIDYLESLCTRAYFFVYGARTRPLERIAAFFATDWPAAAKAAWRETLVCISLTVLGAVAAYVLVMRDSDWFASFIPSGLAEGRGPDASTAALRATLFDTQHDQILSVLATFLFTHNTEVALMAFALGFAFCVPTACLMVINGCVLGAFLAVFFKHGLGVEVVGWLGIHGVTELFAVNLAGAAGFRIGWTLAFPGDRTRLEAVGAAGRQAAVLMGGVICMLFCAGLLEGVGRQIIQSTPLRYGIALSTGVLWVAYLYAPRGAQPARSRG